MGLLILLGATLLLLYCIGAALAEAIYAFIIGIRIALDKQVLSIPAAITHNFLVINLCEPLVNTILITYIGLSPSYRHALAEQPLRSAIELAVPMLILCLPLGGLLLRETYYRKKCLQLFVLGMARWPIVVVAWASSNIFDSSLLGLIIPILMFLLGFKVLWSSIAAGKRELARLESGTSNQFSWYGRSNQSELR